MMAVGMYAQGAGVLAIVLATFIINLRHIIMSTCVFNRMQSGKIATRLPLSFGVTDESFAIFTTERVENCTPAFFFGLILSTWGAWNVGTLIGAVLSDLLPAILTAALGISLYAMFLSLLLPGLRANLRLSLLVLLTAICNYLLSLFLEPSWALVISTLACAFLGVFFVDLETGEEVRDE
jgi:predicted branched-subunit amino acid permease